MRAGRFNVVLAGNILPEHSLAAVKTQLAALIKRDVDFADRLLSGRATTIRSGVDAKTGQRYLDALRRIGVVASLEPEAPAVDTDFDEVVEAPRMPPSSASGTPTSAELSETRARFTDTSIQLAELPARSGISNLNKLLATTLGIVALVAILMAIALPAYQDYLRRPKVAEAERSLPAHVSTPQSGVGVSPATTPAARPAPVPGTTPANAASATTGSTIDLADLITLYLVPAAADFNVYDWATGAEATSPIQWTTNGIEETPKYDAEEKGSYMRRGEVVVTMKGKSLYTRLEKTVVPGKWDVTLYGPRAGFTRVEISSGVNSQELEHGLLEAVGDKLATKPVGCITPGASDGNTIYEVNAAGRKPAWVSEAWSCGSGGCSIALTTVFSKQDAESIKCH